jgi:hypothetical protein
VTLALEILTLVAGAIAIVALQPPGAKRTRTRQPTAATQRPEDLERLERLVVSGRATAGDVHARLRPVLRELALARLRRRGVDPDASPAASRELLGADLWELVRTDRPRPDDLRAAGLTLGQLEAIVERLEAL